MNPNTLGA